MALSLARFAVILVMRNAVVAFVDADHAVFLIAAFLGDHEGRNASDVGLERQLPISYMSRICSVRSAGTPAGRV